MSNDKLPKRVSLSISSEILSLFGAPPLLGTEKIQRYDAMLTAFWNVIRPQDVIEAFWVKDLTDFRWEMRRMRNLKTRLIEEARNAKFKFALEGLHASFYAEAAGLATWRGGEPVVKMAGEDMGKAEIPADTDTKRPGESAIMLGGEKNSATAKKNKVGETKDPGFAADLNHLLEQTAAKLRALNEQGDGDGADVFEVWSRDYELAGRLEIAAEARFNAVLAEIDTYRQGFAERLRQMSDAIIDGEYVVRDETVLAPASSSTELKHEAEATTLAPTGQMIAETNEIKSAAPTAAAP
jgi:hypothetical protein